MIEYARKYNPNSNKAKTRRWMQLLTNAPLHNINWQMYDFRIDGVIYKSPGTNWQEAYEKELVWSALHD